MKTKGLYPIFHLEKYNYLKLIVAFADAVSVVPEPNAVVVKLIVGALSLHHLL